MGLAQEVPGAADYVVRLGSFSKTLAPGLRCGFLTAGAALAERFAQSGLYDSGGCPSQFTACLVAQMILEGSYDENVARLRSAYAERCRALTSALRESLPAGCSVERRGRRLLRLGGLPAGLTAPQVPPFAEADGVSFVAGSRFSVGGSEQGIRLAFTMYAPEQLRGRRAPRPRRRGGAPLLALRAGPAGLPLEAAVRRCLPAQRSGRGACG